MCACCLPLPERRRIRGGSVAAQRIDDAGAGGDLAAKGVDDAGAEQRGRPIGEQAVRSAQFRRHWFEFQRLRVRVISACREEEEGNISAV